MAEDPKETKVKLTLFENPKEENVDLALSEDPEEEEESEEINVEVSLSENGEENNIHSALSNFVPQVKPTGPKRGGSSQKYRSAWEKNFEWVKPVPGSPFKALCIICNKHLRAQTTVIKLHEKSKKHRTKCQQLSSDIHAPTTTFARKKITVSLYDNVNGEQKCIPTEAVILTPVLDTKVADCRLVDMRSDTLTMPSYAMKEAMMGAPLGDDVFGEDPTAKKLQEKVATLLGKEAALFVPTGTMGNLICVLNHCQLRGGEVLLGSLSHIHIWEQGGISQLGGVHPRVLQNLPDGTFSISEMQKMVRGTNIHWPITRLVCVENTHNMTGGKVLPLAWLDELAAVCKAFGLPIHMDGARLFNAAAALQVPPSRIVRDCASVSICLSKGLGAPVGSVIAGSKEFIQNALRLRKVLGGGMRQVGILAAAGIFALDHIASALSRDHELVTTIAEAVANIKSKVLTVNLEGIHSNMMLLDCDTTIVTPREVCDRLAKVTDKELSDLGESIVVRVLPLTESSVRFVVYHDITKEDISAVIRKLTYVINEYKVDV